MIARPTSLAPDPGGWRPGWPPVLGSVSALAKGGDALFIGGDFVESSGRPEQGLAGIDVRTGVPLELPDVDGKVEALAVSGSRLFVGGLFTKLGDVTVRNFGVVDLTTGQPVSGPQFDDEVRALAVSAGTLHVGAGVTAARRGGDHDVPLRLAALRRHRERVHGDRRHLAWAPARGRRRRPPAARVHGCLRHRQIVGAEWARSRAIRRPTPTPVATATPTAVATGDPVAPMRVAAAAPGPATTPAALQLRVIADRAARARGVAVRLRAPEDCRLEVRVRLRRPARGRGPCERDAARRGRPDRPRSPDPGRAGAAATGAAGDRGDRRHGHERLGYARTMGEAVVTRQVTAAGWWEFARPRAAPVAARRLRALRRLRGALPRAAAAAGGPFAGAALILTLGGRYRMTGPRGPFERV